MIMAARFSIATALLIPLAVATRPNKSLMMPFLAGAETVSQRPSRGFMLLRPPTCAFVACPNILCVCVCACVEGSIRLARLNLYQSSYLIDLVVCLLCLFYFVSLLRLGRACGASSLSQPRP
jgi:hypothetical protein